MSRTSAPPLARLFRFLGVGALLVVTASCARRGDPDRRPPPSVPVSVEIQNQNFHDMAVFLETANQRVRIASVVGGNQERAEVAPTYFVGGSIRLVAEPVGPREVYRSDWMTVSQGDRIVFRIGPQLVFSYVVLR